MNTKTLISAAIYQGLIHPALTKDGNYSYIRTAVYRDLESSCDVFIGQYEGSASFYVFTQDVKVVELGTQQAFCPEIILARVIQQSQNQGNLVLSTVLDFFQRVRDRKSLRSILSEVQLTNLPPRKIVKAPRTRQQTRLEEEFMGVLKEYNNFVLRLRQTNTRDERFQLSKSVSPAVAAICILVSSEEQARSYLRMFTPAEQQSILSFVVKFKDLTYNVKKSDLHFVQ